MRVAIFALAVMAGGGAAEAGQIEVISASPRHIEIAGSCWVVRIVSKRLPILRRAIATAQTTRGAHYMCGRASLSAVFSANE